MNENTFKLASHYLRTVNLLIKAIRKLGVKVVFPADEKSDITIEKRN